MKCAATAATLILLFSVVVPFAKVAMVFVAHFFVGDPLRRRRMLQFVEAIAKWSMADVFVVALFIAYFGAQACTFPLLKFCLLHLPFWLREVFA